MICGRPVFWKPVTVWLVFPACWTNWLFEPVGLLVPVGLFEPVGLLVPVFGGGWVSLRSGGVVGATMPSPDLSSLRFVVKVGMPLRAVELADS